ncbi:MAG: AAA family ATPase [Candidatus Thermoplasmatota archaeon]|nr:AAA family ATPase [Candidatus Thermoplasmatota archaeon]
MPKQMSGKTFSNLLDYYINCLTQEDMLSVTFDAGREGTQFICIPSHHEELFHANHSEVTIQHTDPVKRFFQTSLLQQRNRTLFYGYPIMSGPEGMISPLFFIEVRFKQDEQHTILQKTSSTIRVNHYLLSQSGFSAEELINIQQHCNQEEFQSTLRLLCDQLHIDTSTFSPTLDQHPLKRTIALTPINKALVYFGERIDITHNVIVELHQLKKKPLDDLASTSLLLLLTGEYHPTVRVDSSTPLLQVFLLNASQQQAVQHALHHPLTVITGPPGTGKSQVVLNIIANAIYHNKTVLFASKNNKAVDVVIEKFHALLPYKLPVRMGHREHRQRTKTELTSFATQPLLPTPSPKKTEHDLVRGIQTTMTIEQSIRALGTLNESMQKVQDAQDTLIEHLPQEIVRRGLHQPVPLIDAFIIQQDAHRYFNTAGVLQALTQRHRGKQQERCVRKYYDLIPQTLKSCVDNMVVNKNVPLTTVFRWIYSLKQLELLDDELHQIKKSLLAHPTYADLKHSLSATQKTLLDVSQPLFEYHWVHKLTQASKEDLQRITSFFSASEQLASWVGDQRVFRQLLSEQLRTLQQIQAFFPVWVVTNLSAKQSFPLKNNLFDLLIIDEASQCDIVSALPLFYRAKHVVIIGDPYQLKHISLLTEAQDRTLAVDHHLSDEQYEWFSYTKNSLYHLAERIIHAQNEQPLLLNEHYRCHPDIIGFSNEYYYHRQLTVATDDTRLLQHPSLTTHILWHHVRGKTIHATSPYNEIEAERVAEEALKILGTFPSKSTSVGIVTLFRAQSELISAKLEVFKDLYPTPVTIGTAHRFQGDEKDIIIFSPAVSEGVKQGTLHWIQTTSQLLNVAVTRAKSLFIVVGDKETCAQTAGPLQNLAQYVDARMRQNQTQHSPLHKRLYEEATKHHLPLIPQYYIHGKAPFHVDFALCVNGRQYAIDITDACDAQKKSVLREAGWRIRQFSTRDVEDHLPSIIEELKRLC